MPLPHPVAPSAPRPPRGLACVVGCLLVGTTLVATPSGAAGPAGPVAATHTATAPLAITRPPGIRSVTPAAAPTDAPGARYDAPVPGQLLRAFDPPDTTWGAGHRGVDLAASGGDDVSAPLDGTVTFAGPVAGRGVVTILDDHGLRTSLEPVDPLVAAGDRVARGQVVARLAGAASDPAVGHCAPTPCLHWGVRRDETYVDPWALLEVGPVVLLPDDGAPG